MTMVRSAARALRLLYEQLVDRRSARAVAAVVQLVGRVADDHVELHVSSEQLGDPSLDVVGVDERVGVGFKPFATVEAFCWLAPQCDRVALAIHPQVCSVRSNQMLPSSLAKLLAMECSPLACFEQ
jgi:hypothetical protein